MRQLFLLALLAIAVSGQGFNNGQNQQQGQNQGQNQQQGQNQGQNQQQGQGQNQQQSENQGSLLALPEKDACIARARHWNIGTTWYHFSWDVPTNIVFNAEKGVNEGKKVNWLEARNECRKQCMDAVGMESPAENQMIFDFLASRNITYIWTSGRLCDFTGCETREDLKPLNKLGWFWSNSNTKIADTSKTPPGWAQTPWSQTGHTGAPQPDNAEFDINQTSESCLGVLNNIYNDGIKWHDIACYHKKPYICEDSPLLIQYIEAIHKITLPK